MKGSPATMPGSRSASWTCRCRGIHANDGTVTRLCSRVRSIGGLTDRLLWKRCRGDDIIRGEVSRARRQAFSDPMPKYRSLPPDAEASRFNQHRVNSGNLLQPDRYVHTEDALYFTP